MKGVQRSVARGGPGVWRTVAWTALALNVVVAAVFAVPAALILSVGLSAAGKTETPEQYGAAMIFAMLGGLSVLFAILALALAIASWFLARRLPAGPGTFAFLAVAALGPLALLAYMLFSL